MRSLIETIAVVSLSLMFVVATSVSAKEPEHIDIGSRRELFIDDSLVEQMNGEVRLQLHHPAPREIALVFDEPWEGTGTSGYHCIFKDGDLYRMYYKAWNISLDEKKKRIRPSPGAACYAESDDGIHWCKPNLGLVEFQGSKNKNILLIDHLIDGYIVPQVGESLSTRLHRHAVGSNSTACQDREDANIRTNIHEKILFTQEV